MTCAQPKRKPNHQFCSDFFLAVYIHLLRVVCALAKLLAAENSASLAAANLANLAEVGSGAVVAPAPPGPVCTTGSTANNDPDNNSGAGFVNKMFETLDRPPTYQEASSSRENQETQVAQ